MDTVRSEGALKRIGVLRKEAQNQSVPESVVPSPQNSDSAMRTSVKHNPASSPGRNDPTPRREGGALKGTTLLDPLQTR